MRKKKVEPPAAAAPHVEALQKVIGLPDFKVVEKGKGSVALEMTRDSNAALQRIFASKSEQFANEMLMQLRNNVMAKVIDNEKALISGIALINAIKPQNELETLLAMQMAAIHQAAMTFSWRLSGAETIPQQDSAERTLNKLTRTFCTQIEALKRYRTGGEQKVIVQHVNVNDGGQAIVGAVEQGKGRG